MEWGILLGLVITIGGSCAHADCISPSSPGITIPGYHVSGAACMPDPPSSDFDQTSSNYPTCGYGRIALSGDGSYTATTFSSSADPAWAPPGDIYSDGQTYSYVSSTTPNVPVYGFSPNSRCYCMGSGTSLTYVPSATPAPPVNLPPPSNGTVRQYPVSADVISTQNQAGTILYGPVAISQDSTQDPRQYNLFATNAATCGCPNINETPVTNGTDPGGGYVGMHCVPMVIPSPYPIGVNSTVRVLTNFDPTNLNQVAQVMPGSENIADTSGNVVSTIQLPNSDQNTLTAYQRKIWTCASPFDLDIGTGTCTFNVAKHACDSGAAAGSFASAVSDQVSGSTTSIAAQFNNTVNKKLACCLNPFHLNGTDAYEKFDCIDNSQTSYSTFDALWSSSDDPADGGQLNALMLSDGGTSGSIPTYNTRPITGFYSMTGQHCDQFSEFAYTSAIQRATVNPLQKSGQQNQVAGAGFVYAGGTIPIPTASAYSTINGVVTGTWGKKIPTTQQDFLSCPILVRAAMVATCPSMTQAPNALTSVNLGTGNGAGGTSGARCAAAGGIQVQLRIEQVFTVTGMPPAKTFDSVVTLNSTTSMDVSQLILNKVGNLCPPFTTKKGDLCTY